jgi:hypothetical protein
MSRKRLIKVTRWKLICEDCGYEGHTYALGSQSSYGRLFGRTSKNEIVEFNAWEDTVFNEVASIVDSLIGKDHPKNSSCFRSVLGITCDLSPSGHSYEFTGKIKCPNCGYDHIKYGPGDPPIVEIANIPFATHTTWQKLGQREKENKIKRNLQEIDCMKR